MLVEECRAHGRTVGGQIFRTRSEKYTRKNRKIGVCLPIERSDRVDKLLVKQSFRRSRNCNALKLIKNDREWKRKGIFEDTKLGYVTFPELEG